MRNLHELDQYRDRGSDAVRILGPSAGDHRHGIFYIPVGGESLKVLASAGVGWDHVSVSLPDRCPTWDEMSIVHRMFFKPREMAMQLHVPASEHISYHPYCLHLWRPHHLAIPHPPPSLVGAPNEENCEAMEKMGWARK
jgi:hypothetical protein